MSESNYVCAVWYWHYRSPHYELFETEEQAAGFAIGLEDSGNGSVDGVQFPDGRFIKRDEWEEYKAEEEREEERWKKEWQERQNSPKPDLRRISIPMPDRDDIISIPVDEPLWLGIPIEEGHA